MPIASIPEQLHRGKPDDLAGTIRTGLHRKEFEQKSVQIKSLACINYFSHRQCIHVAPSPIGYFGLQCAGHLPGSWD